MTYTGVSTQAFRQSVRCGLFVIAFLCWTPQRLVLNAEQLVQRASVAERTYVATPGPASAPAPASAVAAATAPASAPVSPLARFTPEPERAYALAVAFSASPFGRMRPLSMDAVSAFRAAHPRGTDDRVAVRPRDGLVTLTTAVREGELREIELTLEAETHRVVREVLVFPGIGSVEVDAPPLPPASAYAYAAGVLGTPRLPSADDLDRAELKARLVLGQRGMDVHRAACVSRTAEGIRVRVEEASPIPFAERRTTAAQLTGIDHVRLDFSTAMVTSATARTTARPTERFRLSRWLDRTFADARTRARFGPTLMQSLDTVNQRLTVLAELSQRYADPRQQQQLAADARPLFKQLVDLQYQRLRVELNESRELVSTLSGTAPVAFDTRDTPSSLLVRAPGALSRAQAFERLVRETSASRDDLTDDDCQHLNASFAALWEAVYGPSPTR